MREIETVRKEVGDRGASWQVQYVTNIWRVLERIERAEGTWAPANGPEPCGYDNTERCRLWEAGCDPCPLKTGLLLWFLYSVSISPLSSFLSI